MHRFIVLLCPALCASFSVFAFGQKPYVYSPPLTAQHGAAPENVSSCIVSDPGNVFGCCQAQDGGGDATPDIPKVTESRILGGFVVAGASAVDPTVKFSLQADISMPVVGAGTNPSMSIWGTGRISSIAQPGSLSNFSSISEYVSPVLSSPSQMVQSGEIEGGLELKLISRYEPVKTATRKAMELERHCRWRVHHPTFDFAGRPLVLHCFSRFAGLLQQYATQFASACNDTTDTPSQARTCYVGFIPADRSSFYHNYSAGFRYKKYWIDESSGSSDTYLFPATLDVTFGQNEYVTGGGFHSVVMHVGASTPIPGYAFVTVGFGADLRVAGASNTATQLLLVPPASGTSLTLTTATVVPIPLPQADRDRYLITFGLDLKKIVSLWKKN